MDELKPAISKLDDSKAKVQEPLLEVNLGDKGEHIPTFGS